MSQTTRIQITDVSKIYDTGSKKVEAVKNFTESVKDGEFVSIVGASGCGKTTLLWCLSGLHPATSGTVHIDGELLSKPLPDRIGMVFFYPGRNELIPIKSLGTHQKNNCFRHAFNCGGNFFSRSNLGDVAKTRPSISSCRCKFFKTATYRFAV